MEKRNMPADAITVALREQHTLEKLGVFLLGGSLASTLYGMVRITRKFWDLFLT
jgi:hypothetical protein